MPQPSDNQSTLSPAASSQIPGETVRSAQSRAGQNPGHLSGGARQVSVGVLFGAGVAARLGCRRPRPVDYTHRVMMPSGSRTPSEQNSLTPASLRRSVEEKHCALDIPPGEWVGEYVVVRKLGEGGFGAVYEAMHPVIGKRAAVKVLHAQYSGDEAVTSRFAAEARAVNQIRHRNIVDIFSFGVLPDGRQYYVMELLLGVPLDVYLERAGRLDLGECLPILSEIAKALQAAHDAGFAHRDLKPENVFLELDDEQLVHPKILDFGMAKLLAPGTLPVHKTRSGAPIGSPRYMSPEQCRGVDVDHRTDVYAFGCMAFRMLAGVPPFEAGTALELMMAHVSAPPTPLSSIGTDLGPQVDEALLKMLEKLPDDRPQSMLEAFESLRTAAPAGLPVAPTAASPLLREMVDERTRDTAATLDLSKLRRTPQGGQVTHGQKLRWWLWPVASMAIVATILAIQRIDVALHPAGSVNASIVSHPEVTAPSSQPAKLTASDASPSIPSATITVNAQPLHAELYLNNERVAVAPGPLLVPKSEDPQTLVVRSPGFQSQTVTFVPSTDRTLKITLPPLKPRSNGKMPRDLEDPY
jgi:eukaryotic-like serine/threonine-protein kinase